MRSTMRRLATRISWLLAVTVTFLALPLRAAAGAAEVVLDIHDDGGGLLGQQDLIQPCWYLTVEEDKSHGDRPPFVVQRA